MKLPKTIKKYCPFCDAHTDQKITQVSSGGKRGSMKKGSKQRARLRGCARGFGNHGRWSKPAVSSWKRKTKSTKKTNFKYTCPKCKKSMMQNYGRRVGKVKIE